MRVARKSYVLTPRLDFCFIKGILQPYVECPAGSVTPYPGYNKSQTLVQMQTSCSPLTPCLECQTPSISRPERDGNLQSVSAVDAGGYSRDHYAGTSRGTSTCWKLQNANCKIRQACATLYRSRLAQRPTNKQNTPQQAQPRFPGLAVPHMQARWAQRYRTPACVPPSSQQPAPWYAKFSLLPSKLSCAT